MADENFMFESFEIFMKFLKISKAYFGKFH